MAEQQGPVWQEEFPVAAGGVVSYTGTVWTGFRLVVGRKMLPSADSGSDTQLLVLEVQQGAALLGLADQQGHMEILASIYGDPTGLEPGHNTTYWLSLDARGIVKYGKGYHMEETTLLHCCLPGGKVGSKGSTWWRSPCRKTVTLHGLPGTPTPTLCSTYDAQLEQLSCSQGGIVTFDRRPLMHNPPAVIINPGSATLLDLGWRSGLPACDLPPACQALYAQLKAPDIDLEHDCPLGLSLVAAIRHSLQTPGALLNTTLLAKAGRCCKGRLSKQCYIRVSVAAARGDSPGDPFVLEIWPPGHSSPVHSHGNVFGVTRMLYGTLALRIYNKSLHHDQKPLQHLTLEQGQLTWFSPNWYQTHQLENCSNTDFCCSINGFQYGQEDNVHWPFMRFKGAAVGDVHDFEPVCDFDFTELRDALLEEYQNASPVQMFQGTKSMSIASAPESPATPSGQLMHSHQLPLQHSPTCSAASEALHMYLFDI